MLQAIILCMALCMDAFVASVAYGADRIRIGWKGMALMSGVGSACLGAALGFGMVIMEWLPRGLTQAVCFVSLFFLGLIRLSDSAVKAYINRHAHLCRNIHFSFSSLRFILTIYADPSAADRDRNRVLSAREALFWALRCPLTVWRPEPLPPLWRYRFFSPCSQHSQWIWPLCAAARQSGKNLQAA